jgi:hypothetical protein
MPCVVIFTSLEPLLLDTFEYTSKHFKPSKVSLVRNGYYCSWVGGLLSFVCLLDEGLRPSPIILSCCTAVFSLVDCLQDKFVLRSGIMWAQQQLSCLVASLDCIAPSLHDGARPGPNPAGGRRIDSFENVSARVSGEASKQH